MFAYLNATSIPVLSAECWKEESTAYKNKVSTTQNPNPGTEVRTALVSSSAAGGSATGGTYAAALVGGGAEYDEYDEEEEEDLDLLL